jgi:hypothetical protein
MKRSLMVIVFLFFEFIIGSMIYLYSFHCDYLPWGDSRREGLEFLLLPFFDLPVILMLSFIKMALWKTNGFIRYSYFIYFLIIAVLGFAGAQGSPSTLLIVLMIFLLIALANIVEVYFVLNFDSGSHAG